jgi:hypothetical protein
LDGVLKLRESLVETATALLTDDIEISGLLQELDVSISELEKARKTTDLVQKSGVFNTIFDLLLKFKMLQDPANCVSFTSDNLRMAHFAKRSTESLIGYGSRNITVNTSFEQVIGDLWVYPAAKENAKGPGSILGGNIAAEMLRTRFANSLVISTIIGY